MSEQHVITGIAAPLPINNLDTDQIMPKQFLLGIDKSGLARGVLYDLRFDTDGRPRENFVLNRPEYRSVRILLGGSNFGCGSSREHAVWGLQQTGIDAVIAPSYGEIFYFNALNNRLLLVTLPPDEVEALVAEVETASNKQITIDVVGEVVVSPSGRRHAFSIPPRQKQMLLEGLDMIGMTLRQADAIDAFETGHWEAQPWARIDLPAQQAKMAEESAAS
jgi:3-isopropylmalate/(R)-2-methylmalate dehydratase small subunit